MFIADATAENGRSSEISPTSENFADVQKSKQSPTSEASRATNANADLDHERRVTSGVGEDVFSSWPWWQVFYVKAFPGKSYKMQARDMHVLREILSHVPYICESQVRNQIIIST